MVSEGEHARGAETKARIFISYSRKDMAFADQLEAALKARGFEPLIDRTEIYAFEDWWTRIQALISRADTVVFVLSPDAVSSEVALKEVAHAASLNKRFAPIVCRPVEDGAVPEPLRRLNFIFFDDPAHFETSADALAEALQTDIGWIRQHTEFGELARRWAIAGRPGPRGLLLRSPTLEEAEQWIISRPRSAPEPTEETQAFIAASRQAARSAQRLRRMVQASVFTLMVVIIIGLVGWINQAYIADEWRFLTVTLPYEHAYRPYVLTAANEHVLKPGDSFLECLSIDHCPEMIVVPEGSFMMGRRPMEKGHASEDPYHSVQIHKPFAVSKYELTFAEWDACVTGGGCNGYKPNDQGWKRGKQPAINVNWEDAQQYVAWLSQVTGKVYRLLTEAEYEYATRAGTMTAYPWGNDVKLSGRTMANCTECGSKWDTTQTAPVGSFAPNRFGLYDMVGNVWEWTEDCVHNNYNGPPKDGSAWLTGGDCNNRIVRGGSWTSTPDDLRSAYRNWYPSVDRFSFLGFRVARTLSTPAPVSPLSPDQERALKPNDTFSECGNCPEMIVVPAGSFTMGSPVSEPGRNFDEGPQHRVTFARQFAVGQFELTFAEWEACVGDGGCGGYRPEDEGWGRGRQPVINVSWDDANAYVAWLAKKTGKPYRLLTEAEYEYATRAGTMTAYPWGDDIGTNNANCVGCNWDKRRPAPIGSFAANGFGVYDMIGNVLAWTEDCYHDSYRGAPADGLAWTSGDCGIGFGQQVRVVRGSSWNGDPQDLRSADRGRLNTKSRLSFLGFRIARTLLTR